MEPPEKILKTDENDLKGLIISMQCSLINRLKCIEEKIESLSSKYCCLEEKVENILLKVKETTTKVTSSNYSSDLQPGFPRYISSNTEETYPNGSWLGNANNADQRVRCNISPKDLESINNSCTTAEKMALTLLDYLFDRETQARSNISGIGKHGKEQLDPMKVYGIKCHVVHMFNTSNKEWLRIKQNLDSKCRTAFRRKQKGLSLKVKGSRNRSSNVHRVSSQFNGDSHCDTSFLESSDYQNLLIPKSESQPLEFDQVLGQHTIYPLKLETDNSLPFNDDVGQIIHTEHGDIQVIQATEEQLEQLKHTHHVEILSQADMLPESILS